MTVTTGTASPCNEDQPPLAELPLIPPERAWELARTFKVLANDTRLRLVHQLVRAGECSVGDLADAVGLRPQAVSNQLQRLVDQGVLRQRREGTRVHYRVEDPCVTALLDLALCLSTRGGAVGAEPERAGAA